jgi:hypothetical protein
VAAFVFALTGVGFAILAGVVGTFIVAVIEVIIAFRDPVRHEIIRSRTWRQNLYHMLH